MGSVAESDIAKVLTFSETTKFFKEKMSKRIGNPPRKGCCLVARGIVGAVMV